MIPISLPRWVPKRLIQFLLVLGCLYTMSGGFYNRIKEPTDYVYYEGHWYNIHPDPRDQSTRESLYAFMCNTTTFLGVWVAYHGAVHGRSRLTADRLLLLGLGLMLAGVCGSYYLVEMKRMAVPICCFSYTSNEQLELH